MCAVVDLCGKMVLSYRIGSDMTSSLVTDAIRDARQKEMVTDGLALHSDQGSQYTSQAYFDLTQETTFCRQCLVLAVLMITLRWKISLVF